MVRSNRRDFLKMSAAGLLGAGLYRPIAEKTKPIGPSVLNSARLSFACGLVVTWTYASPRGELFGRTERLHVVCDPGQQHGRADNLQAGNGLQGLQELPLRLQAGQ